MHTFHQIRAMADAVRNTPLTDVLSLAGAVKDPNDKHKWHTQKGSVSVTGQQFMNWQLSCGGGGAIDMVIHLLDVDFKTAVLWLTSHFPSVSNAVLPPAAFPKPLFEKSLFTPPPKVDKHLPRVIHYLHQTRKIPLRLINQLVRFERLYADRKANAVFILLGKEKKIVGAELRGTSSIKWAGLSKGSRKDLGAFFITVRSPKHIVVCESAIDAISYFALYPDCTAISTAGVTPSRPWLINLINRKIEIFCGFDADEIGEKNAREMIRRYPKIKRLSPEQKDWNDLLIQTSPKLTLWRDIFLDNYGLCPTA